MNQDGFRKLISGQNNGVGASGLLFFLKIVAKIYLCIIRMRNFFYSKGIFKAYKADATVISVGNVTAGGTGKTPLVIWVCRLLQAKNIACAILTRGYKSAKITHDEPAILAEACPDAKIVVNSDRIAGAKKAVSKFEAKALVMDDGFQHRRLARDLDIVTIDATCPFGYGKMLPAGFLREPVESLKRADAVVITRCDQIAEAGLAELEENLRSINSGLIIAKSIHAPVCAKSMGNNETSLDQLKNNKIFAF